MPPTQSLRHVEHNAATVSWTDCSRQKEENGMVIVSFSHLVGVFVCGLSAHDFVVALQQSAHITPITTH